MVYCDFDTDKEDMIGLYETVLSCLPSGSYKRNDQYSYLIDMDSLEEVKEYVEDALCDLNGYEFSYSYGGWGYDDCGESSVEDTVDYYVELDEVIDRPDCLSYSYTCTKPGVFGAVTFSIYE